MNRIWIELDTPASWADLSPTKRIEFAEEQCRLANLMLARLEIVGGEFFYREVEQRYCYGGYWGYNELTDNGRWFNLDILAGQ